MSATEHHLIPEKRTTAPRPRTCENCSAPSVFAVQHVEFSDHLKPKFTCARHLSRTVRESEFSEGDEMFVHRIRFDV